MLTIRATARRAVLLTLTVLMAVLGPVPALAADPSVTPDGIYGSLKVDDVPAAYVVLVDASSSMKDKGPDGVPLYTTVKRRLADFLGSLKPADQVAVITFGRATSVVHPLSPANRTGDVVDKELPRSAEESASNHGDALNVAAEQLEGTTAPVAAVLMLTDGALKAEGTPYARLGSPAWKDLKKRYAALSADRQIMGYGLPLAEGTGLSDILGSAFASPRILPVDPTALGSQLNDAKNQVRKQKALSVLRPDRGRGVAVSLGGDGVRPAGNGKVTVAAGSATGSHSRTLEVTLRSRARHVPLTVRLSADAGAGSARVSGAGPVTLQPGRSETVRVQLTWRQDSQFGLFSGSSDFRSQVTLRAEVSSEWTKVVQGSLGEAKFSPGEPVLTEVELQGTVPDHTPGWLYPLVLLVLLLGAAAAVQVRNRRNPQLSGTLIVTDLRSGSRQPIPLHGRKVVHEMDAGQARAQVVVRGRRNADRVVLWLRCERAAAQQGGERLVDTGICELGKSTVLCGIGFSHETESAMAESR
ncbi:VWA domain-containing protein [Streptomyces sp. NPDC005017]|uniref:VWA domain-containing protein n=1 Tax=Streptomyces sp. NPDC005017 TaxID=3364706 RepID=UPI00369E3336